MSDRQSSPRPLGLASQSKASRPPPPKPGGGRPAPPPRLNTLLPSKSAPSISSSSSSSIVPPSSSIYSTSPFSSSVPSPKRTTVVPKRPTVAPSSSPTLSSSPPPPSSPSYSSPLSSSSSSLSSSPSTSSPLRVRAPTTQPSYSSSPSSSPSSPPSTSSPSVLGLSSPKPKGGSAITPPSSRGPSQTSAPLPQFNKAESASVLISPGSGGGVPVRPHPALTKKGSHPTMPPQRSPPNPSPLSSTSPTLNLSSVTSSPSPSSYGNRPRTSTTPRLNLKRPPDESETSKILMEMGKATNLDKLKVNIVEYDSRSSLYLNMRWSTVKQTQTYSTKRTAANTFFSVVDETPETYPAEVYNQALRKVIEETKNISLRKSLEYQLIVQPRRKRTGGFNAAQPVGPIGSSSVIMGLRANPGRPSSVETDQQIEERDFEGAEGEEEESPDLVKTKNDDGTYTVKGGTVVKLVERLTSAYSADPDYLTAFLLTYRSFTTPSVLLDELIERYNIKPPSDLPGPQIEVWKQKRQKPIRLRVCNTLKHWLERHFSDFEDEDVLRKLTEFIDFTICNSPNFQVVGARLHKLVEKKLAAGMGEGVGPSLMFDNHTGAGSRLSVQGLGPQSKRSLLDFDAGDIAKQLTLLEFNNYKAIQPRECLNQAWSKSDKEINAPNIVNMIKRTNAVPLWVATEIVFCQKVKARTNMVRLFISIAEKSRALNNFNAVMEIISGLQLSAIYRLKRTWEGVPQKSMTAFEELKDLMKVSKNWGAYREALKKCNPPCVPYLGVYLTDLTFLDDGNPDKLAGGDLINFVKRQKLSVVIQEIQQYQNMPYSSIEVNQHIRDYLNDIQWVDENELWNMSLVTEPREATPTSD